MQNNMFAGQGKEGPAFDVLAAELAPLPSLIYRALDTGAIGNRTYHDDLADGKPELHLREMIVRHQAKLYLTQHHIEISDEPFWVGKEPLVALRFIFRGVHIRVLKAKGGIVPGCGYSKYRKRFYNQVPCAYIDHLGKPQMTTHNVLFLWDFDAVFSVRALWMAYPVQGAARAENVICAWKQEVAHPASLSMPQYQVETDNSDLRALLESNSGIAPTSKVLSK